MSRFRLAIRSDAIDDLMASKDAIEDVTAFAQKRRPSWRNR
jgi:acetyl-CoA C-acetyltransferase